MVAKEKTVDGRHDIKILKDGRVVRCSNCGDIRKQYGKQLEQKPELKKRLDEIEKIPDPLEKAKQAKQLEQELAQIVKAKNPSSFNGFGNEEILIKEFPTSQGFVEVSAEVVIEGKILHLKSLGIFPKGIRGVNLSQKEIMESLNILKKEATSEGFEKLRITGRRVSGATFDGSISSGKTIDRTFDLTK